MAVTDAARSAEVSPESGRRLTQRDQQRLATREALRSAGLRLFVEDGFRETTVEQIAEAAGVSRRTFFLHFASKDEVLLGHVAEELELLRAELAAAPAGLEPVSRAGHAVAALAEGMQSREDLLLQLDLLHQASQLLAINLEQFTAFEDSIADAVRTWVTAGARPVSPAEDGFAELLGTAAIAALRAALTVWRHRRGRGSLSALVRANVDALRGGLRAP